MLYSLIKPLLFRLDAERAHNLVSALLGAAEATGARRLLAALYAYDDPLLAIECAGLRLANPLGLAAGFDKRAGLIGPMAALGFGHVEVGTVTPRAQPGNPRPRLFRLPADGALINRMGFNSPGMLAIARNLRSWELGDRGWCADHHPRSANSYPTVVGVNIGKNRATALERAAEDYLAAFVALAELADYVAINISSPNTPGLRQLHERAALEQLLSELAARNRRLARPRPLFLKISPDESPDQLAEVVEAGLAAGIAGLIATNTTLDRNRLHSPLASETGGLSGRPLALRSRAVIAQLASLAGERLPIIGVGGVASAADAYGYIRAGASLVQLYTGLIYGGPDLPLRIKRDLAKLLRRDGFTSIAAAVGAG